ncbi:MAG: NADPH-dependent FMN reductase [Bacteroidota bacterium]
MSNSPKKILAICGSTRTNSANAQLIDAIASLATGSLTITVYNSLTALPYFNQDIPDDQISETVNHFRNTIKEADGVLICTPEYVFSLPGILKNAIEWTVSTTVFSDKPTALITASSSGEKAHESLLLVMNTLGIKTNTDLCLHIPGVKSKLNAQGKVINTDLQQKLEKLVECFKSMI